MLKFKSCTLIKPPSDNARLIGCQYVYHAQYDVEHQNGRTTVSSELDVFMNQHTGAVLDIKMVIEDMQCDSIDSMREKLGEWLNRLSKAVLEPVKAKSFAPIYEKDFEQITANERAERIARGENPDTDDE
jgi:hypothetical protein